MPLVRTIIAAGAILTLSANVHGQSSDEVIEEIVVTADLREPTRLYDVPASVTVLDAKTLAAGGHQHFQDVIELVPNLNWSSATNRPRFFQIRGIGERSQYEGAPNPSVGFLVDDIDFSGIGMVASLFDTAQVEVLRGPQGTRYGANALAGLIYVRTADPSPVAEYSLETTLGDDDTLSLGFSASGPVNDNAAYRISVHQYASDGFRSNDFLDVDDSNQRDEFSGRAKFRWQPDDELQLDLTALFADIDNGFDSFAPENTLTVHSDKPGKDTQESAALSLRAAWAGWEAADVVSITTIADSDLLYSFDGDWGNDRYWGEFSPYDFTSETDRGRSTLSQELRWISRPESALFGGTTDWLAGLYLLDLDEDNGFLDLFNGDVFRSLDSDYSALSVAAFGQLDIHSSETTTWTLGLRVEKRDADYRDSAGLDLDPSDTMVGGQLSVVHKLDTDRSGYLTLSRGYKAGGFNLGLSVPQSRREYEPEYLWNLEAGLKGRFLNGRLSANLALFYSERRDMQVETSFQADPTDPLTFVFFTDNAASGSNVGLEADWQFQINEEWSVFGSLGLLETEFDDFSSPERQLDGRDQAHAPAYQFNLGAEYRQSSGWMARAELSGRDEFFFSDSHDQISEPYQLLHLRAGYETPRWGLYAWARNVLDEEYATRGFYFGLEPPDFPNRLYVQNGDPRHLGITARLTF